MGVLDSFENPLSEVGELLDELGVPGASDAVDEVTRGIQDALDQNGLPLVTTRFLVGEPAPGTVPTIDLGADDIIKQAGMVLDKVVGGYGSVAAAVVNDQFSKDLKNTYEQPVWEVVEFYCDEGISKTWRCEVVLEQPLRTSIAEPKEEVTATDELLDAFDFDNKPGGFDFAAGKNAFDEAGQYLNDLKDPKKKLDKFSNEQSGLYDPDAFWWDMLPMVHAPIPPSDFIGNFCRLCIARRFQANKFTLAERWFSGIAIEMEDLGPVGDGTRRRIRIVMAPRLHLLSLRKRCRVFHDVNSIEITLKLLDEHGIYPEKGEWMTGKRRLQPGGRDLPAGLSLDAPADFLGDVLGAVPVVGDAVADVVGDVLNAPIDEWTPKRQICVQYGETDLEFIERILAEDGIAYFFEHEERNETFVLADDPKAAGSKILTVRRTPLRAFPSVGDRASSQVEETAWALSVARRLVPSSVLLRDHNYSFPLEATESQAGESASMLSPDGVGQLTSLDGLSSLAGQAMSMGAEMANEPGMADYGGPEAKWFEFPAELALTPEEGKTGLYEAYGGPSLAQQWLERVRAEGRMVKGYSDCGELLPGYNLNVRDLGFDALHPNQFEPQKILVTSVTHRYKARGKTDPSFFEPPNPSDPDLGAVLPPKDTINDYRNRFEGVNMLLRWRPPPKPRPRIQGVQTAIVIDAAGGEDPLNSPAELDTDDLRRVRVRYLWDTTPDEPLHSSWIRVGQPLAGAGYGALFVPRTGMEVVIGFQEGIPERPMILGAVYDGGLLQNAKRYHPPREKQSGTIDETPRKIESGFVSRSWQQGGERGNSLRFTDMGGKEETRLFAQQDLTETVGQDHVTSVLLDQFLHVVNNQDETVGGDQTLHVHQKPEDDTDWCRHKFVKSDEEIKVGTSLGHMKHDEVVKNDQLQVGGNRKREVGMAETIVIDGELLENETPDPKQPTRKLLITKKSEVLLDEDDVLTVTGDREVRVKKTYEIEAAEIDLQTLPNPANPGMEVVPPQSRIAVDKEGVKMTSSGTARVQAEDLQIESKADRVIVRAKHHMLIQCGDAWITLNGPDKRIVLKASNDGFLMLGSPDGYIRLEDKKLTLATKDISWVADASGEEVVNEVLGHGDLILDFQGEVHFNAATVDVKGQ